MNLMVQHPKIYTLGFKNGGPLLCRIDIYVWRTKAQKLRYIKGKYVRVPIFLDKQYYLNPITHRQGGRRGDRHMNLKTKCSELRIIIRRKIRVPLFKTQCTLTLFNLDSRRTNFNMWSIYCQKWMRILLDISLLQPMTILGEYKIYGHKF